MAPNGYDMTLYDTLKKNKQKEQTYNKTDKKET